MRVLILGCGYVGLPLGAALVKQGHEVVGVRRTTEDDDTLRAAGITPACADITRPDELARLPGPFDWVVNLVSSTRGGAGEYRDVYLTGTRNLIAWLATSPPQKFVFTSSTSVYGQTQSEPVQEEAATEPASETSRLLVETEKLLLAAARERKFPAVILRVAGIYGPGRGHHFLQYLKDEAKMSGQGERHINMIHRDDLVGVILAALKAGRSGEIYNAVDDEPVTQLHFFRWLAEATGKDLPPCVAEAATRKRGITNKRVLNRKLKLELDWKFTYPTFRQGYTAEMILLKKEGKLDTGPAPRE